jgi:hypothetical protein
MKFLTIHIGSPKTGSTTLQTYCLDNRKFLESVGIQYQNFESGKIDWRIHRGLTGGDIWNPIYPNIDGHLDVNPEQATMWGSVLNLVLEQFKSANHVVISNEFLYFIATEQYFWQRLIDFQERNSVKVRLVMYLRDPFDFLYSWYSESVKRGFTRFSFSEFVMEENLIWNRLYSSLQVLLTMSRESSIQFEIFGPTDYKKDILFHFLDFLGARAESAPNAIRTNGSLSPIELDFFRGVHSISRELGLLLCYEKTDTYLQSIYNQEARQPATIYITSMARTKILAKLENLRNSFIDDSWFRLNLDFGIPPRFVTNSDSSPDSSPAQDVFAIGVFLARSFKTGYLRDSLS